jgi:hypothetical protein
VAPTVVDARRHRRFKFEVDIRISSRTCGLMKGHTVDISESGISAILKLEVPLGELVELDFMLPFGPVTVYAMVRQKNAFRYGFQFVQSSLVEDVLRSTCRQLAMDQSLLGGR